MSSSYFREEDDIDPDAYVTDIPRPSPGNWLMVFTVFLLVGVGVWLWYSSVSRNGESPVVVASAPVRPAAPGRYIVVREGERSRVVGGSSVMVQPGEGVVDGTRAETLASFTTTDVSKFTGLNADLTKLGQTVTIDGAHVRRATGDKTFTLDGDGGTLLVRFPEPDAPTADRAVRIIGGDTVDVTGTLKRMPPPAEAKKQFGLSSEEASVLTSGKVYLDAYRVVIR